MQTANANLEERVTALEREVRKVKAALKAGRLQRQPPWWERFAGRFKNDSLFDKVIDAGQAYRRSLTPRTR
jgi:hypothetical protein